MSRIQPSATDNGNPCAAANGPGRQKSSHPSHETNRFRPSLVRRFAGSRRTPGVGYLRASRSASICQCILVVPHCHASRDHPFCHLQRAGRSVHLPHLRRHGRALDPSGPTDGSPCTPLLCCCGLYRRVRIEPHSLHRVASMTRSRGTPQPSTAAGPLGLGALAD